MAESSHKEILSVEQCGDETGEREFPSGTPDPNPIKPENVAGAIARYVINTRGARMYFPLIGDVSARRTFLRQTSLG